MKRLTEFRRYLARWKGIVASRNNLQRHIADFIMFCFVLNEIIMHSCITICYFSCRLCYVHRLQQAWLVQ